MQKRILCVFMALIFVFGALVARLGSIAVAPEYADASAEQADYTVEIAATRGTIYDRYMRPLVNTVRRPIQGASADLLKDYEAVTRISHEPIAVHVIGTLDSEGTGASGIEAAYDTFLTSCGGKLSVRYTLDAAGNALAGALPEISDDNYDSGAGLVLTLDADIQRIAEKASQSIDRGAVVVMQPQTGDLLALVSRPEFDPIDMAPSLNDERSPFVNRAFSAYSVGSTFKTLVAAVALDNGFTSSHSFECAGSFETEGLEFGCHFLQGHGELAMPRALEISCNPYFISLALSLGGEPIRTAAVKLGFGTAHEFAPGYRTYAGSLPSSERLSSTAALANFGFGQGQLTATPIQLANLISAIANGGGAVTPRLVLGTTSDGEVMSSQTMRYEANEVFSAGSASTVREMMISVVKNGSGKEAAPQKGGAGGKTASAQTGQYDENGAEIVHAWFAGFYPGNEPRYTIVVFVEGGDSGSEAACPVFKKIADGICELEEKSRTFY